MLTICFTGHRPDKLGGYDINSSYNKQIKLQIHKTIRKLIDDEIDNNNKVKIICGGALGVDMMAMNCVVSPCYGLLTKDKYKGNIITELAIPFENQACKWSEKYIKRYEQQKTRVDILTYVDTIDEYKVKGSTTGNYHAAKMQRRNEYMVDNSDIVVAVWNGDTTGGTSNCIRYAQTMNKKIVYIDVKK